MTNLSIPPIPRSKMYRGDTMTVEWQDFFRNLYYRVGGSEDTIDLGDILNLVVGSPNGKDYDSRIRDLELLVMSGDSPKDYGDRIRELENRVESGIRKRGYEGKIKELEARIESNTERAPREAWPVGSIFVSVVSTNPKDLIGYGVWSAFGTGRVLIGIDPSDTDFDTPKETGGAKTHDHPSTTSGAPSAVVQADNNADLSTVGVGDGTHTHDTDLAAINHMPPFIAVYFWERTS